MSGNSLKDRYGAWAFIAGAEGIGEDLARIYAAAGINILLVARRLDPLEAVAARLREEFDVEVRTLPLDLTSPTMLDQVIAATDGLEVGMLVYNAGVDPKIADFHDRSLDNIRRVIDLSVIGQTVLAHHFGLKMRERGRGGIIMVGALISLSGGGSLAVYAASKSYIYTLAQGLWHELRPHGVDVLGLIVGATQTPAFRRFGLPNEIGGTTASTTDLIAREAMEQIGAVPIWIPSDQQAVADRIRSLSPAEAVARTGAAKRALQKG